MFFVVSLIGQETMFIIIHCIEVWRLRVLCKLLIEKDILIILVCSVGYVFVLEY